MGISITSTGPRAESNGGNEKAISFIRVTLQTGEQVVKMKKAYKVLLLLFLACCCMGVWVRPTFSEQGKSEGTPKMGWRQMWAQLDSPRGYPKQLFRSSFVGKLSEPGKRVFLAESWPRRVQRYAWREWVFGDHRIQKGEATYVVRAVFTSGKSYSTPQITQYHLRAPAKLEKAEVRDAVKALSGLFYFFPFDDEVPKVVLDELVRITKMSRTDLGKWLRSAQRLEKKWADRVDSLVYDVVHEKGKVIVRKPVLRVLTPYALVRDEDLTPEIFRTYMLRNMISIPYCLDALKFREDAFPYGRMVVDLLEEEKIPEESIEQATELCAYVGLEMWGHFDFAHQREIAMSNVTYRGAYRSNALALFFNRLWILFRIRDYENAEKNGKLLSFFQKGGLDQSWGGINYDLITPNPWLLYRYHSNVLTELARHLLEKDETAFNRDDEEMLREVESAVAMTQIYDGWVPAKLVKLIRQRALKSNDLQEQSRALLLLNSCVRKSDLPKLFELARLGKTGGSPNQKEVRQTMARTATRIIIGHFDAPQLLRELAKDENVSKWVSALAKEALKKNEVKSSSQKNDKDNKEQ